MYSHVQLVLWNQNIRATIRDADRLLLVFSVHQSTLPTRQHLHAFYGSSIIFLLLLLALEVSLGPYPLPGLVSCYQRFSFLLWVPFCLILFDIAWYGLILLSVATVSARSKLSALAIPWGSIPLAVKITSSVSSQHSPTHPSFKLPMCVHIYIYMCISPKHFAHPFHCLCCCPSAARPSFWPMLHDSSIRPKLHIVLWRLGTKLRLAGQCSENQLPFAALPRKRSLKFEFWFSHVLAASQCRWRIKRLAGKLHIPCLSSSVPCVAPCQCHLWPVKRNVAPPWW